MMKTRLGMFLALPLYLVAGCATDPLDATEPDDPATGATEQPVLGPGNPFNYASALDEQAACFGIAASASSICSNIVNSDDRQMCLAMASHSTTPCFTISDRDLLLACQGMALGANPFNPPPACAGISNADMRNFCSGYSALNGACNQVVDLETHFLCLSMANNSNSWCGGLSNANDSLFCQAVSTHSSGPCFSIQ